MDLSRKADEIGIQLKCLSCKNCSECRAEDRKPTIGFPCFSPKKKTFIVKK